jgi:hypothetical protein
MRIQLLVDTTRESDVTGRLWGQYYCTRNSTCYPLCFLWCVSQIRKLALIHRFQPACINSMRWDSVRGVFKSFDSNEWYFWSKSIEYALLVVHLRCRTTSVILNKNWADLHTAFFSDIIPHLCVPSEYHSILSALTTNPTSIHLTILFHTSSFSCSHSTCLSNLTPRLVLTHHLSPTLLNC